VNDILNSRYHYNKLRYKMSWIDHFSNEVWYSAENFDNAKKIIIDYHNRYSAKSKSELRLIHAINAIIWINDTSILTEDELIRTRRWLQQTKQVTKNTLIKMQTKYEA
jgi:predicted metal-dependent hydrolase